MVTDLDLPLGVAQEGLDEDGAVAGEEAGAVQQQRAQHALRRVRVVAEHAHHYTDIEFVLLVSHGGRARGGSDKIAKYHKEGGGAVMIYHVYLFYVVRAISKVKKKQPTNILINHDQDQS